MKVVVSEPVLALWTLPLPRFVPLLNALVAENVVAFGQHRVLRIYVAYRARQFQLQTGRFFVTTFVYLLYSALKTCMEILSFLLPLLFNYLLLKNALNTGNFDFVKKKLLKNYYLN